MSVYLEDHPPALRQYRRHRRANPTGAIVVHTAENTTDTTLPDGGAKAVARFIATRTDGPGSYHTVVDSDSIERVGRYEWEMFHVRGGGNRWSLGLSFACRADQWAELARTEVKAAWTDRGGTEHPAVTWAEAAIGNGAEAAADMARWVQDTTGVSVPARIITKSQFDAGQPGFISHAVIDPGRRTDPGNAFPWDQFLIAYIDHMNGEIMGMTAAQQKPFIVRIQEAVEATAPGKLDPFGADGMAGETTAAAVETLLTEYRRMATAGAITAEIQRDAERWRGFKELLRDVVS